MADDNRLPTNQSQIDIEAALQDVKTAIANLNFILDAQNIAYDSNTSVKNKIDDTLVEDIASLIEWNSQFNIWAAATGALQKPGYKLVGVQLIATNTNSPAVPAISYQGANPTLRIRNWDSSYTFIAMGVWKKV